MDKDNPVTREATQAVSPIRISTKDPAPHRDPGHLVVEDFITVEVVDVGNYTLICTPTDIEALAVGFVYSEGIISSIEELKHISICSDDPGLVQLQIAHPEKAQQKGRNLLVVSSCGACGSRSTRGELMARLEPVASSLALRLADIHTAAKILHEKQVLFRETGAAHASLIFDAAARPVAFAEDIGRHNTLDKAIGRCLLDGRPMSGCGVVLSGRVSFDLVAKAARAGLELIAAVSAPSSLAMEVAQRCNITLSAFVRDDRATVYTHPQRIVGILDS